MGAWGGGGVASISDFAPPSSGEQPGEQEGQAGGSLRPVAPGSLPLEAPALALWQAVLRAGPTLIFTFKCKAVAQGHFPSPALWLSCARGWICRQGCWEMAWAS